MQFPPHFVFDSKYSHVLHMSSNFFSSPEGHIGMLSPSSNFLASLSFLTSSWQLSFPQLMQSNINPSSILPPFLCPQMRNFTPFIHLSNEVINTKLSYHPRKARLAYICLYTCTSFLRSNILSRNLLYSKSCPNFS